MNNAFQSFKNENPALYQAILYQAQAEIRETFEEKKLTNSIMEQSEYLTRAQVCKILHISYPTLYKRIDEGLPKHKIGGRVLFTQSEVDEFVRSRLYPRAKN